MSLRHAPATDLDSRPWDGPVRRYDIFKEGAIALVIVTVLVGALAAIFSSPDDPQLTFKGWAQSNPNNLHATIVTELDGSSGTATYGPPYNNTSDGLSVGPIAMQKWMGVTHPINAADDFVIKPLESQNMSDSVKTAVDQWNAATPDQQTQWASNYDTALKDAAGANGDPAKVPSGDYGPTPVLAAAVVDMAKSGAYDGAIMQGQFFPTDQTKQMMLMGDGAYMDDLATTDNLQGNTWGMVNEAGSWPGQMWLAPFSFWYQLPAFNNEDPNNKFAQTLTDNADAIIFSIMMVVVLIFAFVPFVPGLRSIPRWIPISRLVWKDYYREYGRR
jgi:hypothetical protein